MLDLEKFESGQATLERTPVPVADLLNEAVDAVGQLLRDKNIELEISVPPDLPALPADRDRLMQVLVNLLSNSIKACRADGSGRISLAVTCAEPPLRAAPHSHAQVITLIIADNGKGIALGDQHHIFEKFFQARNQTTRKPEGTGLGLAITKKIIDLHYGRLWVESQPGQGATFFVELPLVSTPELVS
ncbi:sensor histidine kinase [Hymenobacter humi]|uniref:histidine kinase n=1 Tax=Hymenobacter humi TaxID=1411620 RepID=A0ABW2U7V3_9BACT